MKIVAGPWQQSTDQGGVVSYHGPAGYRAGIDLRDGAHGRNVGLFAVPDGFSGGSYMLLGDRPDGFVSASARQSLASALRLGAVPSADRLMELIAQVMGEMAEPADGGGRNPLMPTHKGVLEVHLGGWVLARKWEPAKPESARHWSAIKSVMRFNYQQIKQRDPVLARKWGTCMHRKLRVPFDQIGDPGDKPMAPTTSISESFNKADSDTLGPDLTWTETFGDIDIVSNEAITTQNVSGARAEHDLSSDDHWAEVSATQGATAGASVRSSSSDLSSYLMRKFGTDLEIREVASGGASTQLTSTAFTGSLPVTIRGEADGSTLKLYEDTVEKLSTTDTTHTGFTRTGINCQGAAGSRGAVDDFAAEDLTSNIVIEPAALTASAAVAGPTAVTGNLVELAALAAAASIAQPAVVIGVKLPALTAEAQIAQPSIVVGNTVELSALSVSSTIVAPECVFNVTISPDPLTVSGQIVAPIVDVGDIVRPDPLGVTATVVQPQVILDRTVELPALSVTATIPSQQTRVIGVTNLIIGSGLGPGLVESQRSGPPPLFEEVGA